MSDHPRPRAAHEEPLPPRIELSSPVCYAEEMEAAYAVYADRDELLAAFNELLEAERAGARVTLLAGAPALAPDVDQLITHIHHDEVRWCGVLIRAIQSLDGVPSRKTGAFHEKAMAIADLGERMAFLNRGQAWVVRKLEALLPRIRDERIQGELGAMLAAHRSNIDRVETHLGARGAAAR